MLKYKQHIENHLTKVITRHMYNNNIGRVKWEESREMSNPYGCTNCF